jgi:signal transduction histidine kinase
VLVCGFGPGLMTAGFGAVVATYLFIPPFRAFHYDAESFPVLVLFLASEVVVCLIVEGMHKNRRRAHSLLQRLERARRNALAARRSAQQSEAAKGRFFAAASHDLRQPYQAMRLFWMVASQRAGATGDETLKKALDNLGKAMVSGEELLNALLDVATLEAGRVTPRPEVVPLREILDDKVRDFGNLAEARGLRLRIIPCDCAVRTDPILLKRILRNLITNAIKYTDRGGILVGCRRRGDTIHLQVWDTGRGIEAERLHDVFEDFVQIGNDARNRADGLGLGLSVVARMAKLLDHEIIVRSKFGRGSMFSVVLPVATVHRPAEPVVRGVAV